MHSVSRLARWCAHDSCPCCPIHGTMWFTSSRSVFRSRRHARIAFRYDASVALRARDGRGDGFAPQRAQRYLSRRLTVRRATDHQWLAQNASPQRSLHQARRRAGSAVPHQPHAPAVRGGAREQAARRVALFVAAGLAAGGSDQLQARADRVGKEQRRRLAVILDLNRAGSGLAQFRFPGRKIAQ